MDILAKAALSQVTDITQDYFNLNNGLRKWRTARARAAVTNYKAQIHVVGDSISEGAYSSAVATDWITLGYVGLVRTTLSAKYGDCGSGIIPVTFPNGNPYIVATGFILAAGNSSGLGFGNWYYTSPTAGNTLTYTFSGTGVEIYYVQGSGVGSFTYAIDGGGAVAVTARTVPTNYGKVLIITGLADGSHTIVITQADNGYSVDILGMCPIKGIKGIQVNLVGKYGIVSDAPARDYALIATFDTKPPDLTIIALTANDFASQIDPNIYITNMQKIITKAKNSGDVLITTIGVRADAGVIPQTAYFIVCKNLAKINNCAYLDINSRWGGYAGGVASGFYYDTVHPNNIGHRDIATAILKIIDEY